MRKKVARLNHYLSFASTKKLDPQEAHTIRAYFQSRGASKSDYELIKTWAVAQRSASRTAKQVLAHTRQYKRRLSSSWYLDTKLSAYVSKVHQKFSCSCGSRLEVPAYNICKCGKIWNAYKIQSATKGDTMFVVREVPVRDGIVVANKSRRKVAEDSSDPYSSRRRTRRTSDVLHEKAFSAFDEFLSEQGFDPSGGGSQEDMDRAIDSFEREYGGVFTPSNFDALKNTYMYHEG